MLKLTISWLNSRQFVYITTVWLSIGQALHVFANARPPGIYKEDYIDSLYKFYHEERPDTITCPPTPEWKRTSDFDLNGEAIQDEDDFGGIEDPFHVGIICKAWS